MTKKNAFCVQKGKENTDSAYMIFIQILKEYAGQSAAGNGDLVLVESWDGGDEADIYSQTGEGAGKVPGTT